ncbi:MAG: MmcQ/YjbR family DNA-binding protein [Rhodospirillales bacterium]|nr:MmcQ/YjbR family DNA-binding protein [Rhodospirillales bacterium]
MTYDEFNDFCASLKHTTHVIQWGGSDVWKIGGKVFAIGGWNDGESPAYTFKVSRISFEILKEKPGLRGAPYLASRGMSWIQHYGEPGLCEAELKDYLKESYRLVSIGLTKKKQRELGLNEDL